jgi:rubredoxin
LKERIKLLPMKKYRCLICGHVYDPDEGDPFRNIPPGTPFEELPDDWTCPVCDAPKEEYEVLD